MVPPRVYTLCHDDIHIDDDQSNDIDGVVDLKSPSCVAFDPTTHHFDDEISVDVALDPAYECRVSELLEDDRVREDAEAVALRDKGITTDGFTSWSRVCKHMNNKFGMLPADKHNLYRIWLLTKPVRTGEEAIFVEDIPRKKCDSGAYFREGIFMPYPSGPHWERILADAQYRNHHKSVISKEDPDEAVDEEIAYYARSMFERHIRHKHIPRIRAATKIWISRYDHRQRAVKQYGRYSGTQADNG